ncbi:hypothetical protein RRG08_060652 [Elysia crispata]|uniref:Uncharacterized protein n=1 Tax=Elysia crispata TaxID=231223 RepID=A0AAE1AUB5_9GAST|nr:hypothetical protein RRG08_060652 [Elysia crispata]
MEKGERKGGAREKQTQSRRRDAGCRLGDSRCFEEERGNTGTRPEGGELTRVRMNDGSVTLAWRKRT